MQFSKFPIAVNTNVKNNEPKYPPNTVWICDELSQGLYICIPENIKMALIEDIMNERLVDTTENQGILVLNSLSKTY